MISTKHSLLGFFLIFLGSSSVFAQFGYYEDALRFSQFRSNGSARIIGLGGAQMSLGGDISNIHTNPAGLGFFRRSEFSFSSSFGTWNTESNYLGQIQENRTGNFSIPNISLVISNPRQGALNTSAFKGGSFGISFNRMNQFNTQAGFFSDLPSDFSLLDFYANQYNQFGEPPIGAPDGLPLDIDLIFFEQGTGFQTDPDYVVGLPFSDETVITSGRTSQTSFSYGANFENKFFIGGMLGLSSVSFFQNKRFGEEFFDEIGVRALNYFINENDRINGFGLNLGLGIIFKPVDALNLGINFQSPTWYNINRQLDADIRGDFFDINGNLEFTETAFSNIIVNSSNLNTPLRLSGGATFFIGKNGFITADIDYLDYSKSRLNSRDFNASADNQQIRSLYGQTLNYRVGAEFRYDIWRFRGGYGFYGDPFINSTFDRSMQQFSGGFGTRLKTFYADFALSASYFDQLYNSFPIILNGQNFGPFTEIRNNITTGTLTFGFNF
jgi:long-subunit fatty acid transport protein